MAKVPVSPLAWAGRPRAPAPLGRSAAVHRHVLCFLLVGSHLLLGQHKDLRAPKPQWVWGRNRLCCLHRAHPSPGSRLLGELESVCACVQLTLCATHPALCDHHRVHNGVLLLGGCRIGHRDDVPRKAPCCPSRVGQSRCHHQRAGRGRVLLLWIQPALFSRCIQDNK